MLNNLKKELQEAASPERAVGSQRYFKTGKGQYGEGDIFIGVANPKIRELSKNYNLSFDELQELLNSEIHEERLIALLILIRNKNKEGSFRFYLVNTKRINNWDLVDLSADKIVGEWLIGKDKKVLYDLAKSENLWEKRISIISCFAFIKDNNFDDALAIAEMLLNDEHDLIHKAIGWVLREIGKKDSEVLEDFLKKHYSDLPRTTLRYAIERFEERKRKKFLKGEFELFN